MEAEYRPGAFSVSSLRGTLFMGACAGALLAFIVDWSGGNGRTGFWAGMIPVSLVILVLKIRLGMRREGEKTLESLRRDQSPPQP